MANRYAQHRAAAPRYGVQRCAEGFLPGLCVLHTCPHFDGVMTDKEAIRTRCIGCGGTVHRGKPVGKSDRTEHCRECLDGARRVSA